MLVMTIFVLELFKLYNKEAVSRTFCRFSATASRVAVTGADTALYNFEIVFLKDVFLFCYSFLRNLWTH